MGGIIDKITEFIKELLQGWVLTNFETMFTDVNDKVGTIAGEVSKTPSTWNSGIFDMIKTLSDNVMIPIAGMIISFVLVYELISMVIDKNNLHDFNTAIFIRFFMKACIAVMLLSKTFDIVMAVFDVGSHIVNSAAAAISGETSIDVSSTLQTMFNEQFSEMSIGELLGLGMETMATQMEGRAGVLESEIKQDAGKGNTEKKEEELADLQAKAQSATASQMSSLSDANKSMEEAAKADNRTDAAETKKNQTQKAENTQENADTATDASENADVKTETAETIKNPASESGQSVVYTPIDIRL